MPDTSSPRKRPTNISLNRRLLEEAKALGVNVSQACERGLEAQVAEAKARRWLAANQGALESSNAFADAHGLPLARYRRF
jgi:antitoxin CcdA